LEQEERASGWMQELARMQELEEGERASARMQELEEEERALEEQASEYLVWALEVQESHNHMADSTRCNTY
jgi:hypothetical protein